MLNSNDGFDFEPSDLTNTCASEFPRVMFPFTDTLVISVLPSYSFNALLGAK